MGKRWILAITWHCTCGIFSGNYDNMATNEPLNWKEIPKLPFFVAGGLSGFFGFFLAWNFPHAVSHWTLGALCVACVAFGSFIAVLPFILDHRAKGKLMEINTLGTISDKIQNLEQFTDQITSATNRWAAVQESVSDNAERTSATAKQIADKMTAEVRQFSDFMQKMNDSEKAALRLESEKLRRSETEWLQMVVHILDHIFALHFAASRSDQPKVAEQIGQFQNACRGTVRRVGLVSFIGEPNQPFDPERYKLVDPKQKPFDGAVIAETIGAGYTFQGKLLRPALVRLRDVNTLAPSPAPVAAIPAEKTKVLDVAQDTLALEAD
jgi:molecular chaperone GrpE (heat shock protein)